MIDKEFIGKLEGKYVLKGYVPKNKNGEVIGKSGVTISTGFDLGQQSYASLKAILGEDRSDLFKRLEFYVGMQGKIAEVYLANTALEITLDEAKLIDEKVHEYYLGKLKQDWDSYSITKFDLLPDAYQTVLFSLAYNFGYALSKSLPDTFRIAVKSAESNNFTRLANWLNVFPSKNPELRGRRAQEAKYLRDKLLSSEG